MTYTDHEQRTLDQQSGIEMDRRTMRPKDVLTAEMARWAEEGRRQMWAEYDRCMAGWPDTEDEEEDA